VEKDKKIIIFKLFAIGLLGIVPSCMVIPFAAIHLKQLGMSESLIGLFVSLPWIGMLLTSPFVSKINKVWGIRNAFVITGFINVFYCLTLILTDNFLVWCIANFIFGFVWANRWITSETLINEYSPENEKGKILGIYGTLFCAFIAIGPLALMLAGVDTKLPLYIAIIFYVISIPLTFSLTGAKLSESEKMDKAGFIKFIFANSLVFITAFFGGIFENGTSAIATLYGISLGIKANTSVLIPAIIGFGTFSVQYITGLLTDKYRDKNLYFIFSIILLLACCLLLLAQFEKNIIYITAYFLGAVGGGIYMVSLIHLGYKYKGHELALANSFLVIGYTVGGILGPILSGISASSLPVYGFPLLLIALSAASSVISLKLFRK
jgi:MFS family permease